MTGKSNSFGISGQSGGLENVLGKGGGKLKQATRVEQTRLWHAAPGIRVREKRTLMDRLRGTLGMQQVDGIRLTLKEVVRTMARNHH